MKHILIVDDDIMASHILQEHLERAGHLVTVAESCREAAEALREPITIDLMILDYLMPDGHGTDLMRAMAEDSSLQKPRIILCSSLIDPHDPAWKTLCSRFPFALAVAHSSRLRGQALPRSRQYRSLCKSHSHVRRLRRSYQ